MFDGVTVWAGNNVAICSLTAVVTICCMVYRSPEGAPRKRCCGVETQSEDQQVWRVLGPPPH
ncbi:UNVERIFIED_CONTAM: hypothetical protein Sradi_1817300 [Sesamum radiatum]|uniref:Uncharacterized protein n=1 Tax=Sesamum radiatum TaxID=300843 RepID=A0AAW2TWG8_SESRA